MRPFMKLSIDIDPFDESHKGEELFGYGSFRYFGLKELQPKLKHFVDLVDPLHVFFGEITSKYIVPHIDHENTFTAVNFYLESADGVTRFWTPKPNARPYSFNNKKTKNLYLIQDLNFLDSFKANNYETWILDVSKIHSVSGMTKNRTFIQVAWAKPYAEVLQMLQDKSLI